MRKLISIGLLMAIVLAGCDKGRQVMRYIASSITSTWHSISPCDSASDGRLVPIPDEVVSPTKPVKRKDVETAFCNCFRNRSSDYPNVWNSWMKLSSKVRVMDARLNDLYGRYTKMGVDPKTSDDYCSVEVEASSWHSRLEEYEQMMKQVYLDDSRFRLTESTNLNAEGATRDRKQALLKSAAEISQLFLER